MAGIKPTDFNSITPTGTTELYTQTNGVNGKFTVDDIKDYITGQTLEWTETLINITPSEIENLGTTPKTTGISIDVNQQEYLSGEYEICYIQGSVWNPGIATELNLIGYTGTFNASPFEDGWVLMANIILITGPYFLTCAGKLNSIFSNLGGGVIAPLALPPVSGELKFILVDQTFTPINITGGSGALRIKLKTKVKNIASL